MKTIQRFTCLFAIAMMFLAVGCTGRDGVQSIDTDDAEFSSAEDYAAYDLEMEKLSEGQSE